MAHLDTAYKLGALQAQADFETEISKMAAPVAPAPPPRAPGTAPIQEQNLGYMPQKGGTNAPIKGYPQAPVRQ